MIFRFVSDFEFSAHFAHKFIFKVLRDLCGQNCKGYEDRVREPGNAAFLLGNLSDPIYLVQNSTTVLINYAAHGLASGDFVNFLKIDGTLTGITNLVKDDLFYPSRATVEGYDKDQQLRLQDKGPGQGYALPLAAGKLVGISMAMLRVQAHFLHHLDDPPLPTFRSADLVD